MFQNSLFNGDVSQWKLESATIWNRMFDKSAFVGDLRPWEPTKKFLKELFEGSLSRYLKTRQSVEEREKLYEIVGKGSKKMNRKKTL
jgi:hypothetical protein